MRKVFFEIFASLTPGPAGATIFVRPMNRSDAELVKGCLEGDRWCAAELHRRCAGAVLAYFLRCGFQPADAQDLTQDVFMRAFRSLGTFDADRGGLKPWLRAIARNVARRQWARNARGEHYDSELAEQTLVEPENPGTGPEAREELSALEDCIRHLPPDLARLVELRYVEAMTTRGLADQLDMPEATVRLRLAQATQALEKCLKGKGIFE